MKENKLIMKFMGGKLVDHPELNGVKMWVGYKPLEGRLDLPNVLQFHSSWALLMPVVKKIFNLKEVESYSIPEPANLKDKLDHALLILSKELLYRRVIEFIKWYDNERK